MLLVLISWGSARAQTLIEPDASLSIPHILKTPIISDFAVAPDGRRVALSLSFVGRQTIWVSQGDDESPGEVIASSRGSAERQVDWSPDGDKLAFLARRAGHWYLTIADLDGENARQLTRHGGNDARPRWSPDGKSLAYLSSGVGGGDGSDDTGWDLWVYPVDGDGARRLTEHPHDEETPEWSPDGKHLAVTFNGGRHLNRRIGVVPVEGGALRDLLPEAWTGDSFDPSWSPNGERVAFVSDEGGRKAIYVVPVSGDAPEKLIESEFELTEPAYSPDGRYLAYIENRDGDCRLKLHDFERDRERTLTLRPGVHTQPTWRKDSSAVLGLYEAWNYSRDVWSYPISGGRERESDTLPPDLDVRKLSRPERLSYQSTDGRAITAFLYLPEDASAERPAPLLVRPHGGPTSQWKNGWHPFTQLLVQKGYAVLAPNVRGSSGYGVEFENANDGDWGRGDLEDLVAGVRFAAQRPDVRDERIGIWGVSYGGFLTLAAIGRHPDLFVCAIEAVGMPDLDKLYRETNVEGRTYLEREIGPLRGNLQLYRDLSPVKEVERVQTPLLSFHGEDYPLVPYSTKKPFMDALRGRTNYRLLEFIFRGGEARATYRHDLHPEASWAYVEKVLEFLEIYL
jgi:dipeptidyl aminopeptidase/acylaminoacyl peptidase